jgi:hypothetical protein
MPPTLGAAGTAQREDAEDVDPALPHAVVEEDSNRSARA